VLVAEARREVAANFSLPGIGNNKIRNKLIKKLTDYNNMKITSKNLPKNITLTTEKVPFS
jgi:hypothetical protein